MKGKRGFSAREELMLLLPRSLKRRGGRDKNKKIQLTFYPPFLTPKEGDFRGIKLKTKDQQNIQFFISAIFNFVFINFLEKNVRFLAEEIERKR